MFLGFSFNLQSRAILLSLFAVPAFAVLIYLRSTAFSSSHSTTMAQGNLKLKSKGKGRVTKRQSNLRAAAPLIIKPKRTIAKQQYDLKKSVGNLVGTEKLIASRVGHLELIKGSRRQLEKEQKEEAKKAAKKADKK